MITTNTANSIELPSDRITTLDEVRALRDKSMWFVLNYGFSKSIVTRITAGPVISLDFNYVVNSDVNYGSLALAILLDDFSVGLVHGYGYSAAFDSESSANNWATLLKLSLEETTQRRSFIMPMKAFYKGDIDNLF